MGPRCNRYKGSDLASIDPQTAQIALLFNPRAAKRDDHYVLDERGQFLALTATGRATIHLLKLNRPFRVVERLALRSSQ